MKYSLIILFVYSFSLSANIFEDISCGKYDASIYPSKTEFKGSVESEITEIGIEEFFNEVDKIDPSEPQWLFSLVDRETGKYKKSFPRKAPNSNSGVVIEHQTIQPHLIYRVGDNILASSNNGEFGGSLVLIDKNNKVTLIEEMNIEDIYEMPFGLVITSGLAHMSWNYGDIYLVNEYFQLEKLYSLVGMPQSSWLLENGDLLINSYPSGSQVLTKNGYMKRVQCIANKSLKQDK
ncbi:hypothetical protein [Salinimonas iocasae]|uniref:Uncharacterized protein n=1 Tax=Salinimonas iocasae TaxID=2572577 RepID=A0A5B7Y981_9ALTE|nr:hypothetical protein [Salinimonas iocasae]QCZ92192.1 hypothetical protein FBQ74_01295 [Salinimonas iocasae]